MSPTQPPSAPPNEPINKIRVIYNLPFGLPITNSEKIIIINSNTINLKIEIITRQDRIRSDSNIEFSIPISESDSTTRLWNDRFGQYHYTQLIFEFAPRNSITYGEVLENIDISQEFILETLGVINALLNGCRVISGKYCPRNITRADVGLYRIVYLDRSGKTILKTTGFGTGVNYFGSNQLLDANQLAKLDVILTNNTQMSVEDELVLNADDYLLFDNTRMACIEIQSAVERVLSQVLTKYLTINGKTSEEIEIILNDRIDDNKSYLNSISSTITGGIEWRDWKTKCSQKRNKVVHNGVTPDKATAETAIKAGKIFIELLKQFR